MDIIESTRRYDRWLKEQLKGDIFHEDVENKHEKMAADAFQFLRATYWRWAEMIQTEKAFAGLMRGPEVVSVGDIHVENFGTWRDLEGRVIWGVNDFDEAAEMPYAIDLVRLAVSAVLAKVKGVDATVAADSIVEGYRAGLKSPTVFVLDAAHTGLRETFVADESERADFWKKMTPKGELKKARKRAAEMNREPAPRPKPVPPAYREALKASLPVPKIPLTFWYRTAGTGSLGRPRWVARGDWHNSPVVREAKAIVPSGWTRHGAKQPLWCAKIAAGAYRSGDPWYSLKGSVLVRRLSPNNRKLELDAVEDKRTLVNASILRHMGRDLAAIHLGITNRRAAIQRDLDKRADKLSGGCGMPLSLYAAITKSGRTVGVRPIGGGEPTDQQNALLRRRRMGQS